MEFKPDSRTLISIGLTVLLSFSALGTSAEDGTSGTLPDSIHRCEIVTAAWSPTEETPVASPVAPDPATPVASPVASPVAIASPVASPVVTEEAEVADDEAATEDEALIADLQAASHSILDCMSDNNLETLLALTSEEFRGSWLGFDSGLSDDDFSIILPMLTNLPYALVGLEVVSAEDNTATAIVHYTTGRQLKTGEWTFQLVSIDDQQAWQVQSETPLPTEAPEGAAKMSLIMEDGAFFIDAASYPAGDIVIDVVNLGTLPHEALIVRVPEGTEAADFAAAPSGIPDGGTFVAQVTVPTERGGTIVLVDIRPGTYTVVDLLPDASGNPNISNGMIATFTVE